VETDLPDMAEIVPRLAEVEAAAAAELVKLAALADMSIFEARLQRLKHTQEDVTKGELENQRADNLNYDNLLTFRQTVERQNRNLNQLMQEITGNISLMDAAYKEWSASREFWVRLKDKLEGPAKSTFGDAFKDIDKKNRRGAEKEPSSDRTARFLAERSGRFDCRQQSISARDTEKPRRIAGKAAG